MKDINLDFDDSIQARDDNIWIPTKKFRKQYIRVKPRYRNKIEVVEDYEGNLVEEIPDEEYRLRIERPRRTHFKGRESAGTRGEWDWLIKIAQEVINEYGDKPVESKKIVALICPKYNMAQQTLSQRLRRCWRRGWIRRWQMHNNRGEAIGRHGKKLPHFWKFERIDDDKFGHPRIDY